MSSPSRTIRPLWCAPSICSFMRLRLRKKVDLPQPDGPIKATTEHSGIVSETSYRACVSPYQNERLRTSNFDRTPLRSGGSRPTMLLSERIAEYDSVGTDGTSPPRLARTGGIIPAKCVDSAKKP